MSFGYTKKFNQYVKVHTQKSVHTITQKRVTANGQNYTTVVTTTLVKKMVHMCTIYKRGEINGISF